MEILRTGAQFVAAKGRHLARRLETRCPSRPIRSKGKLSRALGKIGCLVKLTSVIWSWSVWWWVASCCSAAGGSPCLCNCRCHLGWCGGSRFSWLLSFVQFLHHPRFHPNRSSNPFPSAGEPNLWSAAKPNYSPLAPDIWVGLCTWLLRFFRCGILMCKSTCSHQGMERVSTWCQLEIGCNIGRGFLFKLSYFAGMPAACLTL